MTLKPACLQWSDDGTPRNSEYDDVYFQTGAGLDESRYVFLEKNNLPARFAQLADDSDFYIAELGFGTGLNVLLAAQLWCDAAPKNARLHICSIEKNPLLLADLARVYALWPDLNDLSGEILAQYPPLVAGFHRITLAGGRISLTLLLGDVADMLAQMSGQFDAWFLDGFTPTRNPAMWRDDLYAGIANLTAPGGTLSTFTVAGAVRRGLKDAGFTIAKEKGFGIKWSMTVAQMPDAPPDTASDTALNTARPDVTALNPAPKTVAIIGAGIAGCATAYALAARGYSVTVYERHDGAAQEASGNPRAVIYPKLTVDDSAKGRYHSHAFCFTRQMVERIAPAAFTPCGVLRLDITPEEAQRSQKLIAAQDSPPDFTSWQPRTPFGPSGLLHPSAGMIDPQVFCAALLAHPNIKTVYGRDITDWHRLDAAHVIIAQANASSGYPETATLPLVAFRGQVTYLRANDHTRDLTRVVCHKGYLTPAIDGIHYAGATFQKEEPDLKQKGATPAARGVDDAENIATLNTYLPGFGFTKKDIIGQRAAYRAATPDKIPMVGRCPDVAAFETGGSGFVPQLYVCAGFGAHGMAGAPLAGEMIAAMINGDPLPVPADLATAMAPERFILRTLKRSGVQPVRTFAKK